MTTFARDAPSRGNAGGRDPRFHRAQLVSTSGRVLEWDQQTRGSDASAGGSGVDPQVPID